MKIHEKQYVINDLTDWQERVIHIRSWEEYVEQFYSNTSYSKTLSLPRLRKIKSISKDDNSITVEFYHDFIDKTVIHKAKIVDDQTECKVIKEYDNFPKRVSSYICAERFDNSISKFEFYREYECTFKEDGK